VLQDCRCLLWRRVIDRVLAKEYQGEWLEIPEDTKEIARQDLLLECRLRSKHCTSTASSWLTLGSNTDHSFGPTRMAMNGRSKRNTESSMPSISVTKRFESTSGCS
jgi:hypothetical protein